MNDEIDSKKINSEKSSVVKALEKSSQLEGIASEDELTTKETSEEVELYDTINQLQQETGELIIPKGNEFCKHLAYCPGKDSNCFHPYKTEGCHEYRKFEKL